MAALGFAATAAMVCAGVPAAAQTAPDAVADSALLQTMLNRPTDLEATAQFAANAKKAGDSEASIGALERLLFFNPNLLDVRYELGALYFHLGSFEMARGYFETVLGPAETTPEMKARVQEYLDAIEKKLLPDQWSGFFQTGLRYQTNASYGPSQQALGATQPINSVFRAQPDGNWFALGAVNYVHDFGSQSGDVFEASLLGYDAQQFNVTSVDTGFLDLRFGPRFGVLQDVLNGVSIKPYGVVTGALFAGLPYLGSAGGGVTMHFNWAETALDPYVEVRHQGYSNSGLYPLASGLDGTLVIAALPASGLITEGLRWQAKLAYNYSSAASPWYGYNRIGLDMAFPRLINSPWGGRSWTLTPSFGVAPWFYKQANPTSYPNITERDFEWRVGVGLDIPVQLDIPIQNPVAIGIQVQYRALESNIPGNTVNSFSVSMGPTVSF